MCAMSVFHQPPQFLCFFALSIDRQTPLLYWRALQYGGVAQWADGAAVVTLQITLPPFLSDHTHDLTPTGSHFLCYHNYFSQDHTLESRIQNVKNALKSRSHFRLSSLITPTLDHTSSVIILTPTFLEIKLQTLEFRILNLDLDHTSSISRI